MPLHRLLPANRRQPFCHAVPTGTGGTAAVRADTMFEKTQTRRQLDSMFAVLSHPYRRRILTMIAERNPRDGDEFAVEELATPEDDLSLFADEAYHGHLPKLDDAGYVEWDREDDVIRRGPRFHEIAPLIALMRDHADELPAGWP